MGGALAFILVAAWLAMPATAAARVPCGNRDGKTIARSGPTRVYIGTVRRLTGGVAHRTVACKKGARRVPLDDPSDADNDLATSRVRRHPLVLRRRHVAYVTDEEFVDGASEFTLTEVSVVDLRTGRIRTFCPSGRQLGCARRGTRITDLVLRRTGGFAFVGHRELRSLDATGERATVDVGVDPGSLRLRGGRISWTKDGRRKSAELR